MMEETSSPLHFDGIDTKKDPPSDGRFVRKPILIAVLVLIVLLIILVIVLGALLGSERAKQRTKDAGKPERELKPTGATPGPTTPGTEVWWNVRLPRNVVPEEYDLTLKLDLKKSRLEGKVEIAVEVRKPTPYVLVHVNQLNVTSVRLENNEREGLPIKNHFRFQRNQFYVVVMRSPLGLGKYRLKMAFDGMLKKNPRNGVFLQDYKHKDGKTVTIATSQLQAIDARKVFPCFDEPAMKAKFRVVIIHDPAMRALSNMPVQNFEVEGGWRHEIFEETPKMSTYLLAFVVCDFDFTTSPKTNDNVEMKIYAPKDQMDQTKYATDVAPKLMNYYTTLFDVKYSLPKADLLADPNHPYFGMENWGLMTFRSAFLLVKESESSVESVAWVAKVIAHEIAHQWFGNLVTMTWWDDLWLNEGFANFLMYPGTEHLHPDWKMDVEFTVTVLANAFALDGLTSSHPLSVPIERPEEIDEIFDAISYDKGASVLRMLDAYIGRNMFSKGVTNYLKKFEYGNANTSQLWQVFDETTCAQSQCVDVKGMMDTWTLQMGYPVLTIKKSGANYEVTQERFLYDKNAKESQKYKSKYNYKWHVPFTYIAGKARSLPGDPSLVIMDKTSSVQISWDGNGWIKGNVGYKGFYRVNYEDSKWDALAEQMNFFYKTFNVSDRVNLIDDAFQLARGGYLKYGRAFNITVYLRKEEEHFPWKTAITNWAYLQNILSHSSPAYKLLEEYIRYQSETQYEKLGFEDVGSHLERYQRAIILSATCKAAERTCLQNATDYFSKWMNQDTAVPANLRELVYPYGVALGGEKEWNFLFEQLQQTTVASEKKTIITALAASREPWILSRYLKFSLNASKISSGDTPSVIGAVSLYSSAGLQMAWDFIQANWPILLERYGEGHFVLKLLLARVSQGFSSEYRLQELNEFRQEKGSFGVGSDGWDQILERVQANIDWREANEADIEEWLRNFFANKPGALKTDVDSGFSGPF